MYNDSVFGISVVIYSDYFWISKYLTKLNLFIRTAIINLLSHPSGKLLIIGNRPIFILN